MLRQIGAGVLLLATLTGAWTTSAQEDDGTLRRRPGAEQAPELPPIDPTAVSPPTRAMPRESLPVPDRWRLIDAVGMQTRWWDPYNQNTLKGDRPIFNDWFINVGLISDTIYELRGIPTPVAPQSGPAGSVDVFGQVSQNIFVQNIIGSVALIKGDTAFIPPTYEFRVTPVFSYNRVSVSQERVVRIDPLAGHIRNDAHVGLQEAFFDYHIRNVSDRYDFDSVRIGIQPVIADFRGFLFHDQQLGARLFGTRDNNYWQYNIAWFRRLEKDTNAGLNDLGKRLRDDDIFFANIYRQDLFVRGYTGQAVVAYNRNREGNDQPFYNKNGFLERPASIGYERPTNYDVVYLGLNGDGHFGRLNLTNAFYVALGNLSANPFTSRTRPEPAKVRAWFAAIEPSVDLDWIRLRGQALYASGDRDPYDNKATGFDAIFENPQFAGAETSYWVRQPVPLIGGGGVGISGRNGILNSLRSSKEQGQSNFINPGTVLLGAGADFDVLPELRVSTNVNHLWFANKGVVEALRNQPLASRAIGWDASVSAVYRPTFIQNIAFRASGAMLFGGRGFADLFDTGGGKVFHSVLFNLILTY
jgi:hypothetical protein